MRSMFKHLFTRRPNNRVVRGEPEPMPRMRWY
jgi:hypothetical protein